MGLPELGIAELRAKIDTGARTSALHAVDFEVHERDGVAWVEFHVPLPGVPRSERCTRRIIDDRPIKNTSGVPEHRYIIETMLVLGRRRWNIEISLADRENMEFDLILGRTAIRGQGLLINSGNSFLAGPPSKRFLKNSLLKNTSGQTAPRKKKKKKPSTPEPGDEL